MNHKSLNSTDTMYNSVTQSLTGNAKYKDTLFKYIFNDPQFALPLVNALMGTSYKDPSDIHITTLEDVLHIGMKNDVSLLIDSRMVLFEQQSTPNRNMPYRQFQYVYHLYKNLEVENGWNKYSTTGMRIPRPFFITFYNGTIEEPQVQILKLSDLYAQEEEKIDAHSLLGKIKESLEVKVLVVNINKGKNTELMEECAPLREYTACIETVREEKRKGKSTREGIVYMLNTMQKTDSIYAKIQLRRAEVETMLETEFDIKEYGEILKNEGKEEGLKEGKEIGKQEGLEEGQKIGEQKKAVVTCKKMLEDHLPVEIIQKYTSLSEEEIQKIKETFQLK